jgi:hypothetical protein
MYELCCDMIDLLINMSEIYGQPNGNNIRTIHDDDDDEGYLNEERENLNDDDNNNEHHAWNIETQTEYCEDDNVQINGLRSNSYLNSKNINNEENKTLIRFIRSFRYNTSDKSSTFIIN